MKTKAFLLAAMLATALPLAPCAFAQNPDTQRQGRRFKHERMLANLSPEERTKLRAAHQKAMADPSVQAAKDRMRQARREFRDLRRQSMLRADPSIQPILDKLPNRERRES